MNVSPEGSHHQGMMRFRDEILPDTTEIAAAEQAARDAENENAARHEAFLTPFPERESTEGSHRFTPVDFEVVSMEAVTPRFDSTLEYELERLEDLKTRNTIPSIVYYDEDPKAAVQQLASAWLRRGNATTIYYDMAAKDPREPQPNFDDFARGLAESFTVTPDTLTVVHAPHPRHWQQLLGRLPEAGSQLPVVFAIPKEA